MKRGWAERENSPNPRGIPIPLDGYGDDTSIPTIWDGEGLGMRLLNVEPLNMLEPFADSAINDWSGTLYAVGGVPGPNMMMDVHVGNMPDDGVVADLSLENQALIGANEKLRALVREMRRRESATMRLCDDLQYVILARDNQISSYMNEIDQLRYDRYGDVGSCCAFLKFYLGE
ncbi:hypothetical protein Tco_1189485 [Tanacetum coccineum]